MGCGCNKNKANVSASVSGNTTSGKYQLRMPDGQIYYFDNEVAARAANTKLGGGGLVRRT